MDSQPTTEMTTHLNAQSVEQLFADARQLALANDRDDRDRDESRYWECVWALRGYGTREVWECAAALCESNVPLERMLGADVLAQLGMMRGYRAHPKFWRRSVPLLLRRLATETNNDVLVSLVAALGHLKDPRAVPALVRHKAHPSDGVRWNLAIALCGYDEPLARETLSEMTRDDDGEVRDWATFGLGRQTEVDTPALREALAARLDDKDDNTRVEAIFGLAHRGDERALEPLIRELEEGWCSPLFEAATALASFADPRVLPLLQTIERDELPSHWIADYHQAVEKYRSQSS